MTITAPAAAAPQTSAETKARPDPSEGPAPARREKRGFTDAPLKPPSPGKRRMALIAMATAMLIFGANFSISRQAILSGLSAHDLLMLRFATAGLLLLPTFLRGGVLRCGGVGWPRGLLLTLLSGFPMSFLMLLGLSYAPAAHGASITPGTVTLIGITGSVLLFGAILTRRLVAGMAAMIAGLSCLAFAGSAGASGTTFRGDMLFVAAGLLWGLYPLLIQRWQVNGLKATAVVSVLSLSYLPVYALLYFRGFDVAPWWVFVLHAINQGVLNVIVGLWIWSWATPVLGAAVAGRFPPLLPVVGTLLAIPILGEVPSQLQLAGIALIIGGIFIASWRRPTRAPHAQKQQAVPADADQQRDGQRGP